jgi:hypothetical protein
VRCWNAALYCWKEQSKVNTVYVVYDYVENGNSVAYDAHVYPTQEQAKAAAEELDPRHTNIEKAAAEEVDETWATCSVIWHWAT